MPDPTPILPEVLLLPQRTIFGHGRILTLLPECRGFGARGVLVHGAVLASGGRLDKVLAETPAGMTVLPYRYRGGEPTLAELSQLLAAARDYHADWVAGVGGGSILDLARGAAGLYAAEGTPEVYHDGAAIERPGIPFVAAPTTAGTGSEATMNAVLTNARTGAKKSIRDPSLMARLVILDPALLSGCPRAVIAASGMDALTQAIEAFTSRKATVLSDDLARRGLGLISTSLEAVWTDAATPAAAELLAGSYLTGVALSFARLGVVHGIVHPLGALYHVPHGVACAVCLPHALELNRRAFGAKYAVMCETVGGDLCARVEGFLRTFGIASPFAGKPVLSREAIIRETLASGSTQANPRTITREDVEWLLERLFAA